jgi:hypothetical protein
MDNVFWMQNLHRILAHPAAATAVGAITIFDDHGGRQVPNRRKEHQLGAGRTAITAK